jgi:hypothetical protein
MRPDGVSASVDAAGPPTASRWAARAGIVVSLLLIPVTLLGYATATAQLTATARAVDDRLAEGVPLIEAAAQGADTLATAAGTIAQTAEAAASETGSLPTAFHEVVSFSGPYHAFSESYRAAAEAAGEAVESVQSVATMLPPGVGEDLRASMANLEAGATQLDEQVDALLAAPTVGVVPDVASGIASLARRVQSGMVSIGDGLAGISAQLQSTRDAVGVRSSEITLMLTILAVVMSAWLAYTATLNVVLLRLFPKRRPGAR